MTEAALPPLSPDERKLAFLAFSAIVGGGVLAYQAATAAAGPGGLLGVDTPAKTDEGAAQKLVTYGGMGAGLYMTYEALKEARAELAIGTTPLVLGVVASFGLALLLRSRT